jgi:ATP-dependent Clp protease ATP-binding subunit ClpA
MPTRAEVVPLTPRLQQVLSSAECVADRSWDFVGVEHVFVAALEDRDSVPAQALTQAGVSVEAIAELVRDVMRSPSYLSVSPAP